MPGHSSFFLGIRVRRALFADVGQSDEKQRLARGGGPRPGLPGRTRRAASTGAAATRRRFRRRGPDPAAAGERPSRRCYACNRGSPSGGQGSVADGQRRGAQRGRRGSEERLYFRRRGAGGGRVRGRGGGRGGWLEEFCEDGGQVEDRHLHGAAASRRQDGLWQARRPEQKRRSWGGFVAFSLPARGFPSAGLHRRRLETERGRASQPATRVTYTVGLPFCLPRRLPREGAAVAKLNKNRAERWSLGAGQPALAIGSEGREAALFPGFEEKKIRGWGREAWRHCSSSCPRHATSYGPVSQSFASDGCFE